MAPLEIVDLPNLKIVVSGSQTVNVYQRLSLIDCRLIIDLYIILSVWRSGDLRISGHACHG
jgi:hypothetical protein